MATKERILVIKHGALGDWVLATGPFAAVRRHHAGAHITLLTAPTFADWGVRCGWFNEVWTDDRPGWIRPLAWMRLRRRLVAGRFTRVYDLQTSQRTGLYFRLLPRRGRPEWSGIAVGCSHPHDNPRRDFMHVTAARAEQLRIAGIREVPPPDLGWLDGDVGVLVPADAFALIIPGGSAHRTVKRWPAERFAELAGAVAEWGMVPVLVGTAAEGPVLEMIARSVPKAVNLCGRTGTDQVAALARRARFTVGNDTGPVHMAAVVGCPTIALFGEASHPERSAPQGRAVRTLRSVPLDELPVDAAIRAIRKMPWSS